MYRIAPFFLLLSFISLTGMEPELKKTKSSSRLEELLSIPCDHHKQRSIISIENGGIYRTNKTSNNFIGLIHEEIEKIVCCSAHNKGDINHLIGLLVKNNKTKKLLIFSERLNSFFRTPATTGPFSYTNEHITDIEPQMGQIVVTVAYELFIKKISLQPSVIIKTGEDGRFYETYQLVQKIIS